MADLDEPVATMMTTELVTVTSDTPVREAVAKMTEHGVLGVVVVDSLGAVEGVFSVTDAMVHATERAKAKTADDSSFYESVALLRLLQAPPSGPTQTLPVSRLMAREIAFLRPTASVRDAARLMAERRIHRVLILDERQQLRGLVSALDVCRHVAAEKA